MLRLFRIKWIFTRLNFYLYPFSAWRFGRLNVRGDTK